MKKVIKATLFLIIFVILFIEVFNTLWLRKTSISYFYEEPKNSMDVAYIGSSNVIAHYIPTLAYKEYGFTTSIYATYSQSFDTIKYFIEEVRKYQNPKLYIIDIAQIINEHKNIDSGEIRTGADSMKFSLNRIKLINKKLSHYSVPYTDYINYYFSFNLYHNRWKDILSGDLKNENENLYKGYTFNDKIEPQISYKWVEDTRELPEYNHKELLDLLEYIKENDLNVLFVIPARIFNNTVARQLNEASKIIENKNYSVINFNNLEDYKIDYLKDFNDGGHLNIFGATKYTLYFGKYLKEKYNLSDHRNIYIYSSWEKEHIRLEENYKKIFKENYDYLINEYKK